MVEAEKSVNSRAEARAARRRQLIDATMKCIARKGISGMTLADVASEAGLSQGIVNLHFESKDNLLRETLEALAGEYRSQFERALARADESPAAGLLALMELDLSPGICTPAKLAVWFAFWGEVKSRPTYRKICDEIDRYYDQVVEGLCGKIIEEGGYSRISAAEAATALTAMTNGLWLSCLISPQAWDRRAALTAVRGYLATVFPDHFRSKGES
jgi:TetR/AcrR family transcriptional repressor of bet genes